MKNRSKSLFSQSKGLFGQSKGLISAACALALLPILQVKAQQRPNFVIIVADDMGYGDIGINGNTHIKTPNIDKMAKQGMIFNDFHSNGAVSSPTRCGLLTGRYQQRAGLENVLQVPRNDRDKEIGLPSDQITFAKVLADHGYQTALIGKWHLGYLPKHSPTNFGFQKFIGFKSGNVDYQSHRDRYGTIDWWDGLEEKNMPGYTTTLLTTLSEDYIKEHKDGPFCLYIAHAAPHAPLQGPREKAIRTELNPEGDKNSDRPNEAIYKDMVEELDRGVGQILKTLKKYKLDKNTLVVFFSDNGPVISYGGSAGEFRGAKGDPWEGGHRVPGIFYMPGTIKKGSVCDQTVMGFDLFPTMLDMAHIEFNNPNKKLDGVSLVPVIKGEKLDKRLLFWGTGNKTIAVRDGQWKLLRLNEKGETSFHLFDLSKDPYEKENLIDRKPEMVQRLDMEITKWAKSVYSEVPDQFAKRKQRKVQNNLTE